MYSEKELEEMSEEDLRLLIGLGLTKEEGRELVFKVYMKKRKDPHAY